MWPRSNGAAPDGRQAAAQEQAAWGKQQADGHVTALIAGAPAGPLPDPSSPVPLASSHTNEHVQGQQQGRVDTATRDPTHPLHPQQDQQQGPGAPQHNAPAGPGRVAGGAAGGGAGAGAVPKGSAYRAASGTVGASCELDQLGLPGLRDLLAKDSLAPEPPEVAGARARMARMAAARYHTDDCDVADSDLAQELVLATTRRQYVVEQALPWAISVVTGLLAGCFGAGFNLCIRALNDAKFTATKHFISPGGSGAAAWAVMVAISAGYAAVAGALGSFLSPQASGSGIPDIRAYLNGVHIPNLLSIRTLIAKTFGVSFTIASGIVAGKEGPFIHIGAILGSGVARLGSESAERWGGGRLRARLRRTAGAYFRQAVEHRDHVAAGAAAGVSTAFGAPIGGVLFAIEQGTSWFRPTMAWHSVCTAGVGLFIALLIMAAYEHGVDGSWSARLGAPREFNINPGSANTAFTYTPWELGVHAAMGVAGGVAGAALSAASVRIMEFRSHFIPRHKPLRRMLEVVFLAVLTTSTWFLIAYTSPCLPVPGHHPAFPAPAMGGQVTSISIAGNGGIPQSTEEDEGWTKLRASLFPQLWCEKPGEYSAYGSMFFTPVTSALAKLYHAHDLGEGQVSLYHAPAVACLFTLTLVLSAFTYGMGAASGVFVPTLLAGAAGGRLVGRAVRAAVPAASAAAVSLPSYAVVGSAALLGGVTRMLLSSCVIVMETTGAEGLVVPLIIAATVGKLVADALYMGLYDTTLGRAAYPFLPAEPENLHQVKLHAQLGVADVMTRRLHTLPVIVRIRDVVEFLRAHPFSTIPLSRPLSRPRPTAPAAGSGPGAEKGQLDGAGLDNAQEAADKAIAVAHEEKQQGQKQVVGQGPMQQQGLSHGNGASSQRGDGHISGQPMNGLGADGTAAGPGPRDGTSEATGGAVGSSAGQVTANATAVTAADGAVLQGSAQPEKQQQGQLEEKGPKAKPNQQQSRESSSQVLDHNRLILRRFSLQTHFRVGRGQAGAASSPPTAAGAGGAEGQKEQQATQGAAATTAAEATVAVAGGGRLATTNSLPRRGSLDQPRTSSGRHRAPPVKAESHRFLRLGRWSMAASHGAAAAAAHATGLMAPHEAADNGAAGSAAAGQNGSVPHRASTGGFAGQAEASRAVTPDLATSATIAAAAATLAATYRPLVLSPSRRVYTPDHTPSTVAVGVGEAHGACAGVAAAAATGTAAPAAVETATDAAVRVASVRIQQLGLSPRVSVAGGAQSLLPDQSPQVRPNQAAKEAGDGGNGSITQAVQQLPRSGPPAAVTGLVTAAAPVTASSLLVVGGASSALPDSLDLTFASNVCAGAVDGAAVAAADPVTGQGPTGARPDPLWHRNPANREQLQSSQQTPAAEANPAPAVSSFQHTQPPPSAFAAAAALLPTAPSEQPSPALTGPVTADPSAQGGDTADPNTSPFTAGGSTGSVTAGGGTERRGWLVGRSLSLRRRLSRREPSAVASQPPADSAGAAESDPTAIVGVLSRATLLKILQAREGFCKSLGEAVARGTAPGGGGRAGEAAIKRLRSAVRRLQAVPMKPPTTAEGLEQLFGGLSEQELDAWVNLRHYMQRVPFTISANASLGRAYRMFRSLGLHHLLVTPAETPVIGVITRTDLLPDKAELVMHDKLKRTLAGAVAAAAAASSSAAAAAFGRLPTGFSLPPTASPSAVLPRPFGVHAQASGVPGSVTAGSVPAPLQAAALQGLMVTAGSEEAYPPQPPGLPMSSIRHQAGDLGREGRSGAQVYLPLASPHSLETITGGAAGASPQRSAGQQGLPGSTPTSSPHGSAGQRQGRGGRCSPLVSAFQEHPEAALAAAAACASQRLQQQVQLPGAAQAQTKEAAEPPAVGGPVETAITSGPHGEPAKVAAPHAESSRALAPHADSARAPAPHAEAVVAIPMQPTPEQRAAALAELRNQLEQLHTAGNQVDAMLAGTFLPAVQEEFGALGQERRAALMLVHEAPQGQGSHAGGGAGGGAGAGGGSDGGLGAQGQGLGQGQGGPAGAALHAGTTPRDTQGLGPTQQGTVQQASVPPGAGGTLPAGGSGVLQGGAVQPPSRMGSRRVSLQGKESKKGGHDILWDRGGE